MSPQVGSDLLAEVLHRNEQRLAVGVLPGHSNQCTNSKLLDALRHSAESVFSKMCGVDLQLQEKIDSGCAARHFDISGIISISGGIKSSIAVHITSQLVFAAAENFLGSCPGKLDADMLDLVGELTNMVAGGAKERMDLDGLSLGLPTVVAGPAHQFAFSSGMNVSSLVFKSTQGLLAIDVGLKA